MRLCMNVDRKLVIYAFKYDRRVHDPKLQKMIPNPHVKPASSAYEDAFSPLVDFKPVEVCWDQLLTIVH